MDIVIRATAMFAFLFVLLRLMGKRELSEMTPFELLMLIVMGDLIQQGVTHNDFSVTGAVLAIATFAFWGLVLNAVTYKWKRAENMLDGRPSVIIQHGKVLNEGLADNRLTISEIESEMRLAGIAHIGDVDWAVLETNGKISFIRKGACDGDDVRSSASEQGPNSSRIS